MKRSILFFAALAVIFAYLPLRAQSTPENVDKVYVVFKTHLDVGFTDLSSVVTERYINEFIPKAIDLSEKLESEHASERYVWTTGAWLVREYLKQASPEAKARFDRAVERGDIVWNAVPYTVESEVMNRDLFETCLLVSRDLDKKYGKKTIAAKMTDVPGHTRSIISPMSRAGIAMLHVGVNPASPVPSVPEFCLWRDVDGSEIILVYQQSYGSESLMPDGKSVISVNFTGDNHGPHTYEQVKAIYADLRKRYPKAELIPSSFNEIAGALQQMKDKLPVVTSEIGDTWIYGYGSSPIRMAEFRALSALYSRWIAEGKIVKDSPEAIDFAVELGLIAEHTQGMDIKTHLANWDKYDTDEFLQARTTEPFRKVERSWAEIDEYIYKAISMLPKRLQKEAVKEMHKVEDTDDLHLASMESVDEGNVSKWSLPLFADGELTIDGLVYRTYNSTDYDEFLKSYLRCHDWWAYDDLGKTGLDRSAAVSASIYAEVVRTGGKSGKHESCELAFPYRSGVDQRMYPLHIYADMRTSKNGSVVDLALTIVGKPAVRLPESYWLSFGAPDIKRVIAEKIGERVDVMDVVKGGNRQMHGIDRYVDVETASATYRIWSREAFLVGVGEARGINYSTDYPSLDGGIHFNLSNNLWGTNFSMWNDGSLTYHFTIERID